MITDKQQRKLINSTTQAFAVSHSGKLVTLNSIVNRSNARISLLGSSLLVEAADSQGDSSGVERLRHLLHLGADPCLIDSAGRCAIHWAARNNNLKIIALLAQLSPVISRNLVNCPANNGETPLMWAAANNRVEAARLLVQLGANRKATNRAGKTARDVAFQFECWSAYVALAACSRHHVISDSRRQYLLEKETVSQRLCHFALVNDGSSLNRELTKRNCNNRWRSQTPMMCAASAGSGSCLELLLSVGADPLLSNWQGWTVWHFASDSGRSEVMHQLPKETMNAVDDDGWTPLMVAACRGHRDAVARLIRLGVDCDAVNRELLTAAEEAELAGKADIAEVIRSMRGRKDDFLQLVD